MNNYEYYAHGKLLLSAEYFVLYGAKAIALPLQCGQSMEVAEGRQENVLSWKAFMQGDLWFSCDFKLPGFEILHSSEREKALMLQEIFNAIRHLNPDFRVITPLEVHTHIDFNNQWGLGSSSTLIANLAKFADVDAFRLNEIIFNGSGFDIACATADGPLFYQKNKKPESISLDYPFLGGLYFIYSGLKKSTRHEVRRFLNGGSVRDSEIDRISSLSEQIALARELTDFQKLIAEHEKLVSGLLHLPTVKSTLFSDFQGEVKSLGAWGGDFYLVATGLEYRNVLHYFKKKGLRVVFPWKELVLNNYSVPKMLKTKD